MFQKTRINIWQIVLVIILVFLFNVVKVWYSLQLEPLLIDDVATGELFILDLENNQLEISIIGEVVLLNSIYVEGNLCSNYKEMLDVGSYSFDLTNCIKNPDQIQLVSISYDNKVLRKYLSNS